MTIGPEQRNAAMRGEPYDIHSESASERRAKNYHAENIGLRAQLEMSRKATGAAQELLEAERQKNAALNDKLINAEDARAANANLALEQIGRVKELRLLRTNDAATIADLERRLREAEGQLKAQRYSVSANVGSVTGNVFHPWIAEAAKLKELAAENAELRRTISLTAKAAAEVQDNFRLIAELASDPADEKRKENTK